MATAREDIVIKIRTELGQFAQNFDKMRKTMKGAQSQLGGFGRVMSMDLKTWRAMNDSLTMGTDQFEKFAKSMDPRILREFGLGVDTLGRFFNTSSNYTLSAANAQKKMTDVASKGTGKLANVIRETTHGMRGFRMEMLGVMFFGMGLQKTFMNLLNPILEVYGVFELWRWLLLDLTIGLMDDFYDDILNLTDAFTDLDPELKKVITSFIILGAIVGFLLFLVGMFSLGIGSLTQLGPNVAKLSASIGGLAKSLGGFFGAFGWILAFITVILIGIWLAWKDNWGNIHFFMQNFWDGLEMMITGALDVITGIIDLAMAMLNGDFEEAEKAWNKIMRGIEDFLVGLVGAVISIIQVVLIGITRVLWGLGTFLGKLLVKITSWFVTMGAEFFAWAFDTGAGIVEEIAAGIRSAAHFVRDALQGIIDKLPGPLKDLFNAIWETGGSVLGSVAPGMRGAAQKYRTAGEYVAAQAEAALSEPLNAPNAYSAFSGYSGYGGVSQKDYGLGTFQPTIVNNFYGFTSSDLDSKLDDRDRRLVSELGRTVYE